MEKYTMEELRGLAEEAERRVQNYLRESLGGKYVPPTEEEREGYVSSTLKAYACFNEVFGKPKGGKFFG